MAILLAAAAIALIAGCGGDDDSASQPQTSADNASGSADNASNGSADGDASPGAGSGSDGDQNAAASSPKAAFLEEGNDICREAVANIQRDGKKVFREVGSNGKEFLDQAVNDVIIPNLEAEVRGLRQLNPPPGEEQQVEQVISAIEGLIGGLESNPKQDDYYPYEDAEQIADRYGLDACGAPALR